MGDKGRPTKPAIPSMAAADLPLDVLLAEARKRERAHINDLYKPDDQPGHNQLSFHTSTAKARLVSGGNRSGKSMCAAAECFWEATATHPYRKLPKHIQDGGEIWVISDSYITLETGLWNHLRTFLTRWPSVHIGPTIPGPTNIPGYITLKNAHGNAVTIRFRTSRGGEQARQALQSARIISLYIDEEVDSSLKRELLSRLWDVGGGYCCSASLISGQPWMMEMERNAKNKRPDYFHVALRTDLNPHIDQAAVRADAADMSQEEREVRILGKSLRQSGLWYPTYDEAIHLCDPIELKPHTPILFSLDPGARTCAAMWVALAPDGKDYCVGLMYLHNSNLGDVADYIARMENWTPGHDPHKPKMPWIRGPGAWNVVLRIVDKSAVRRLESGEAGVADQLATDYGIECAPALNISVVAGIEQARAWLEPGPDEIPQFRLCRNLPHIDDWHNEIWNYRIPRDTSSNIQNEKKAVPLKKRDHLLDAWKNIAPFRTEYDRELHIEERDPDPDLDAAYRAARPYKDNPLMYNEVFQAALRNPAGVATGEHLAGFNAYELDAWGSAYDTHGGLSALETA